MNSLSADIRCAIAYFLDMRSLAAMSLVDRAWHKLLSDRRVRNRARERCIEDGLPALAHVNQQSFARGVEHWYHLVAIEHEARFIERGLERGECYLSCPPTKSSPARAAWLTAMCNFYLVREEFEAWTVKLYPLDIPPHRMLQADDSLLKVLERVEMLYMGDPEFTSVDRFEPAIEHFVDFDFLRFFASRADSKEPRRGFLRDDERTACTAFVAFFRESLRVWQLYFAAVRCTESPCYTRIQQYLNDYLPRTIDELAEAVDAS